MGCRGDVHGTLTGEYLGAMGEGIIREKTGVKWMTEEETSWNCFLTKFFLTPKSQAPCLFLTTWVHPQKTKIPFLFLW